MKIIKLNQLAKNNLSAREMNNIKGGDWTCTCSWYYANNGGSSTMDNGCANAQISGGGHSTEGDNKAEFMVCTP
ncbi:hypothetical protein MASR1M31_24630 [Porphyromonadaceae bacterium]